VPTSRRYRCRLFRPYYGARLDCRQKCQALVVYSQLGGSIYEAMQPATYRATLPPNNLFAEYLSQQSQSQRLAQSFVICRATLPETRPVSAQIDEGNSLSLRFCRIRLTRLFRTSGPRPRPRPRPFPAIRRHGSRPITTQEESTISPQKLRVTTEVSRSMSGGI
jgi:hypothetical protein